MTNDSILKVVTMRNISIFVAAFLCFSITCTAENVGKTYYVDSVKGSPGNSGLSGDAPFSTIQQAVNMAGAGDSIIVAPGVYLERVTFKTAGKKEAPIVLRSVAGPGKTIISAANPAIRKGEIPWKLEDKELQLYSVALSQCPARVLYSGVDLFPYPDLQSLKEFTLPPDKSPGIEHGCFYDKAVKLLYVRLHAGEKYGSQNPAEHVVSVAPPHAKGFNGNIVEHPAESCVFIYPDRDVNIIIDGFTFETPGAAGVVTSGGNLVVRNCCFKGCRFGVFGKNNPPDVFIENCHYDQAFSFEDMLETIEKNRKAFEGLKKPSIFWWQRKHFYGRPDLKNYETGLPGGVGKNWHIRDNVVEEAFEGISGWGITSSENAQIYGNIFRRLIDNAVETENRSKNMRIYYNRMENIFEPLSWQPLGGLPWPGPIFIYRNIVVSSPLLDKLWPNWTPGLFKIGAPTSNWARKDMGTAPKEQLASRISKRFVMVDYPGFLVFNNTLIFPYGNLFKRVMPTSREFVNFRFFNNIFMTHNFDLDPEWKGSLIEFYTNIAIATIPENKYTTTEAGTDGIVLDSVEKIKFTDFAKGDYSIRRDSPAAGKGKTTLDEIDAGPDIGAVPAGGSWQPAAGPGAGIPEEDLSGFQKLVRYDPEFVRTPGTRPGLWAVYSPDKPSKLTMPVAMSPENRHSFTVIFRPVGEDIETHLFSIEDIMTLSIERKAGTSNIKLKLKGKSETFVFPIPAQAPGNWCKASFAWENGSPLKAILDDSPLTCGKEISMPSFSEKTDMKVTIYRIPILDVNMK